MNDVKRKREYKLRFMLLTALMFMITALGSGMFESYSIDKINQAFIIELFCPILFLVYFYVQKFFDEEYKANGKEFTEAKVFATVIGITLLAMVCVFGLIFALLIVNAFFMLDDFVMDLFAGGLIITEAIAPILSIPLCIDGIYVFISRFINKTGRKVSATWIFLLANLLLLWVGNFIDMKLFDNVYGGSGTAVICMVFVSMKVSRWIMVWMIVGTVAYAVLKWILKQLHVSLGQAYTVLITLCLLVLGDRLFLVYQRTHNINLSWLGENGKPDTYHAYHQ